ncbi:RNA polymerase sigma factor [Pedobacter sp. MC2016-14]|uniref:RNA polymerase sigma factor n=1 Tax=Pedobacter sp. MC2016-14 TaxID=2897327 RepID=UPI001E39826B|nr:RNA polymerase sigma factor [Pedobacter sp. MC2016-14]MCD0489831.1 RNA polymerase sigma factor [Pedobacter sp. MC2016-14]
MNANLGESYIWDCFVNGDQRSFEQLYHLHYQSLTDYAVKFGHDDTFIEEVVQDLFVKLWKNRASLTKPNSIRYYLVRSLRNLIYNKLQVRSKELYIGGEAELLAFELKVNSLGAKDGLEHWDDLAKRLLADLTDRQKEAVYLLYVEDFSYQEIADLLKIQIGGTYKLIYRAISRIKEKTKELEIKKNDVMLGAKI